MREKSEPSRAVQLIPWIPTMLGVTALLTLMVIATIRLTPWSSSPRPLLPAPAAAPPFVIADQDPSSSPALISATSTADSPPPATATDTGRTAHEPTAGRPTTVATPATHQVPPEVTGHYSVLNSYGDSFIGQVLVVNDSTRPQDWTVVLTFPADVGRLRTSWLESLPQPTLTRSGQTYTWRSTVPLAAHSSGELRFQFDRPGTREDPTRCLTNGSACG